jgi:hypothetical protein
MSEPAARSPEECLLYLSLLACPRCGEDGLEPTVFEPYQGFWVYQTECVHCGHIASFRFAKADPAGPSRLIDAGQYLAYAERIGELVPAEPDTGLMPPQEAVEELREAIDAVVEALRFVPQGADAVPREALWATESLARYDSDPDVFRRRQLLGLLGTLRRLLSEHAEAA